MVMKRVVLTSCLVGLGALALITPSANAQAAQKITGCISSDATCPPNGYPYQDSNGNTVKMPQPPLDTDTDGMGGPDAWGGDITVSNDSGDEFPPKDECGNVLCLVCIPDPAGAGCGADYFSPRIKAGGAWPGTTVGKCHYTYGQNSWKVEFGDADGDGVADKFTKSTWRSCDAGSSDPTSDCYSPTAGEWITYVWDEKTGKVVVSRTKPGTVETDTDFIDHVIEDSKIVCEVPADDTVGESLGLREDKLHLAFGPDSAFQQMADVSVGHTLDAMTSRAVVGESVLAVGELTNHDDVVHVYSLRVDAVGVADAELSTQSLTVAPGDTATYAITGMVRDQGDVALVVLALCQGTDPADVDLNSYLTAATFSPRGPTMADFGGALAGSMGNPLLQGHGQAVEGGVLELSLSSAAPGSTAWLLVSDGLGQVPFAGGTLQAVPFLALTSLSTDAVGNLDVDLRSPGLAPGESLGFQFVIDDPAAVQGFAISNAVESSVD